MERSNLLKRIIEMPSQKDVFETLTMIKGIVLLIEIFMKLLACCSRYKKQNKREARRVKSKK